MDLYEWETHLLEWHATAYTSEIPLIRRRFLPPPRPLCHIQFVFFRGDDGVTSSRPPSSFLIHRHRCGFVKPCELKGDVDNAR